jgi:thiol-disulfide isomerase/thioredoxin
MLRPSLTCLVVSVACLSAAPTLIVASPEASCEELEKRVTELTRRVEALESRQEASQAKVPQRAAPNPAVQQEARLLYAKIDKLVAEGEIEKAKESLAGFNKKYAGTPDIRWVGSLNREFAVIGKSAPESWVIEKWFQGEAEANLDGRQTTLVIFWEAWCPHCKREMPRLQKLYDDHKAEGLQILGLTKITRSATEDSVRSILAESSVGFPIAKETGELSEYFSVKGIPAAALVKEGKIVWRGHPMRLTDEMLGKWL